MGRGFFVYHQYQIVIKTNTGRIAGEIQFEHFIVQDSPRRTSAFALIESFVSISMLQVSSWIRIFNGWSSISLFSSFMAPELSISLEWLIFLS